MSMGSILSAILANFQTFKPADFLDILIFSFGKFLYFFRGVYPLTT